MFTGRCTCGDTSLSGTAAPLTTTICHCTTCQHSQTARVPFLVFTSFLAPSVTISPAPTVVSTSAVSTRFFCAGACGELLGMSYSADPERVHLLRSKISSWVDGIEPVGARPCKHIFVAEALDDSEVDVDGLPRYEGFRDGEPTTTESRLRHDELARGV